MGTRADFYIKQEQEPKMLWLGSIAWDGYPEGIDKDVLLATSPDEYVNEVRRFLAAHKGTLPDRGWPWPWDNSKTTDYSYVFVDNKVMGSSWGNSFFDPLVKQEDNDDETQEQGESIDWPDMTDVKNVRWDMEGSGLIILSTPKS